MSIVTSLSQRRHLGRQIALEPVARRPTTSGCPSSPVGFGQNERPANRDATPEHPCCEPTAAVATDRIWAAFVLAEARRRVGPEPKTATSRTSPDFPRVSIENVRAVISDYAQDPAHVDLEIHELRRVLGTHAVEMIGPVAAAHQYEAESAKEPAFC